MSGLEHLLIGRVPKRRRKQLMKQGACQNCRTSRHLTIDHKTRRITAFAGVAEPFFDGAVALFDVAGLTEQPQVLWGVSAAAGLGDRHQPGDWQ